MRIIAGKYEWNGAREVGDCSVRIVRADINYDDGELKRNDFNDCSSEYDFQEAFFANGLHVFVFQNT